MKELTPFNMVIMIALLLVTAGLATLLPHTVPSPQLISEQEMNTTLNLNANELINAFRVEDMRPPAITTTATMRTMTNNEISEKFGINLNHGIINQTNK